MAFFLNSGCGINLELELQELDDRLLHKTIKKEKAIADKAAEVQPSLPDGRRLVFREFAFCRTEATRLR
jgi:hypothetical protein